MSIEHHGPVTLHHGDCLDVLRGLPDASVDSIVTDPPYGLGFMGREWDALPPGLEWARECLRVLKPGGHLLAFGGTRTWHRLACAVEDAGFEVRDSIAWLYGSGFPKSLDVSKAIDKHLAPSEPRDLTTEYRFTAWMRSTGVTARQVDEITGTRMGGHYLTANSQPAFPTRALLDCLRPILPAVPAWIEDEVERREAAKAEARARAQATPFLSAIQGTPDYAAELEAATAEAQAWEGWGTALKPAFEPVVVARKPLAGTVAANVLAHGTGALNIDGCRIGDEPTTRTRTANDYGIVNDDGWTPTPGVNGSPAGRWPANVVLDEHQAAALDRDDDDGGASRFFYTAKAPSSERVRVDGTAHPTVKPLDLMRWLVRLVTPPGGTVLEPFAGSGTTAEACLLEGFACVAIEREADYLPLIRQRINRRRDPVAATRAARPVDDDPDLFDLLA